MYQSSSVLVLAADGDQLGAGPVQLVNVAHALSTVCSGFILREVHVNRVGDSDHLLQERVLLRPVAGEHLLDRHVHALLVPIANFS
jgi:hypothetical protein